MNHTRTPWLGALDEVLARKRQRRDFLRSATLGGLGILAPFALAACSEEPINPSERSTINFGSPSGALNLIYASVQLQLDFYTRVNRDPFVDIQVAEINRIRSLINDKYVMTSNMSGMVTQGRISEILFFDFHDIDFSRRASVMSVAQMFEEAGVSAANWATARAKTPEAALATAKLGSVLSRHATAIRLLRDSVASPDAVPSFGAGVTGGLDGTMEPAAWQSATKQYFRTTIDIRGV